MFRFKQFSIRQQRCAMKVGTDGVLLGAWATIGADTRRVLDIGTGTGLIAIILAQRTAGSDCHITGIDIESVDEARENGVASPWSSRLEFVERAVQAFRPQQKFDLILSNPPYFVDSLLSPDMGRTTARHTLTLPFEELRDAVVRMLADKGRFALILPLTEAERFVECSSGVLSLVRRCEVRTTPRRAPKRVLMEFSRVVDCAAPTAHEKLTIGTGEHECYTDEYRALTADFYLKF